MRLLLITSFGVLLMTAQAQAQGQAQAPAQPVPDPPAVEKAEQPAPAEQELIYQGEATSILGRQVRDPAGEIVGRIVDVLVGDAGTPRAAVIEFGGFMGVGNRRVAVTWRALRFGPATSQVPIALEMTEDQIKAIPEFKRSAKPADAPVSVAVPPRPVRAEPPATDLPAPSPPTPSPPTPSPPPPSQSQ
jgi:hypothetical protein